MNGNGIPPTIVEPRLTTPEQARSAFRNLRWRLASNGVRSILAGSRLRVSMIAICSAIFWAGLFGFFFEGFQFLKQFIPNLSGELVEVIFSMFFLSLLIMLIFSTGIILYTGLFQSREAAYLLTTPASSDRIFAYKFAESLGYSSWAFLLLGSPMMVAFGIVEDATWQFYAIFPIFFAAFVLIPGSLGAIACILVAAFFPRRRKTIIGLGAGAVALLLVVFLVRVWRMSGDPFSSDWIDGLFGRLEFSRHPLWPSRWISAGLVASVRGDWADARFYLTVIAAHAGLAYLIAAATARDLYRLGYGRVQGGRSSRRRHGLYGLDAAFHRVFFFLPSPIRLLILKDLRTFRRDPAQWSQFLIFFGLLAFYFINIRRLSYDVQKPYWRNLISFLNLSVTALILSTFTSRFIFPLMSLEGRNFWVLGLLPLKRASILWGKFAFSAGISLVATEVLVILSDLMLRMGPAMILLHVGMVAVLCLGLSGISVGLGARLANLKEVDPSKIAAGFGGTLNLLVSLAFIVAIVTSLAVPCHFYFAGADAPDLVGTTLSEPQFRFWMTIAILVSLIVGVVGTVLPLRIGIRAFQEMEL
ncbi:putative ABC transporter permease subunit [Tundrisphaera sp. TA3]|uniref:putative ABC transporter permease subunit n=1 Tax=Tundrisphaera sp. TA3 TaxID=3435775 RepID=UPI003EBF7962